MSLTISKKSPYYKEFKKEIEFFNGGMKLKDIHILEQIGSLDRFITRKLEKQKIKLLEEIYQIKLS